MFRLLTLLILVACQSNEVPSKQNNQFSFSVQAERIDTTSFKLLLTASSKSEVSPSEISLVVTQGTSNGWSSTSSNRFETTITSSVLSGEVSYDISLRNINYSRKAVILPTVNALWDQPESVPGDVNTDGWEDSPEISPDGTYLIVSTYSPISILQCILDGTLATDASCNNNSFASFENQRPNLPYRSRIISNTVISHVNSLVDPPDTTNASPPVSSYLFKRQNDGTYKVHAPIYMDWSGSIWGLPFGFNFRKKVSANIYEMYFSIGDPILANGNQLQKATINLDQTNIQLGSISRVAGSLVRSNWSATPLPIAGLTHQAGNPGSSLYGSTSNGFIFWDDESRASGSRELYFATESTDGSFGTKNLLALGNVGVDKYQPFFYESTLYYSLLHGLIVSKPILSTTDLTDIASFGALTLHLGVEGTHSHVGRITAIGEPSIAVIDGNTWMYFAYSIQGSSSVDLNIGRVRLK